MSPAQIPKKMSSGFSRCEERSHLTDYGKELTSGQKTDATIKGSVERALWKDDVLRGIELAEIDVYVKEGVIYLDGHIANTTSQNRIQRALRAIPGVVRIQNNLIMDDKLTYEVAGSLGTLEHTYGCKFFTGASHGVVSLNGIVSDENVKWLAEKRVAANSNVRAVINNVRVSGAERDVTEQPFLQPTIGASIYFMDGISGIVKKVIINPNNRRVVAMTVWAQFTNPGHELHSLNSNTVLSHEHLVVVPMDVVRYMTKVSGFLHIKSHESERYVDFDPTRFSPPADDWKAPYPYCPDDVLFPVGKLRAEDQTLAPPAQPVFLPTLKEQLLWEQVRTDENLGG